MAQIDERNSTNVLLIGTNKFSVVDALLARPEFRVRVLTEPWYADEYALRGLVEVHVIKDISDFTAAISATATIMRSSPIDAIIGPSERSVQTAAFLRSYFDLPGTTFDVARGFTAKHIMKRKLREADVPIAEYRAIRRAEDLKQALEDVGLPALIKTSLGTGSVDVTPVRDTADLSTLSASVPTSLRGSAPATLVEEFLPLSGEFHIDGIVVDGEPRFVAVSRYFSPLLTRSNDQFVGSVLVSPTDPSWAPLEALHTRSVNALGLQSGITHLEVLETEGRLIVGEVACRPGGGAISSYLDFAYGIDLWAHFVDVEVDGSRMTRAASFTHSPRAAAWCGLPLKSGVVTTVTSAAELERIDGVCFAAVQVVTGQEIAPRFHSASQSGYVLMEGTNKRPIHTIMHDVRDMFTLETCAAVPSVLDRERPV